MEVLLDDVVNYLNLEDEDVQCFIDKESGELTEICSVSPLLIEGLKMINPNLIPLPSFEELKIIEMQYAFCETLEDEKVRNIMKMTVEDDFYDFYDSCFELQLDDAWMIFKLGELKKIAIAFCRSQNIPYSED